MAVSTRMSVGPLLMRVDDWKEFITASDGGDDEIFLPHERTGRPLGHERFVKRVSKLIGRDLIPKELGDRKEKERQIGIVSAEWDSSPPIMGVMTSFSCGTNGPVAL